jgi:hypothetical protein
MQEPVLPIILQQDFGYGRQYTGYRYMEYFRIGLFRGTPSGTKPTLLP